jgi:hypothetical protein
MDLLKNSYRGKYYILLIRQANQGCQTSQNIIEDQILDYVSEPFFLSFYKYAKNYGIDQNKYLDTSKKKYLYSKFFIYLKKMHYDKVKYLKKIKGMADQQNRLAIYFIVYCLKYQSFQKSIKKIFDQPKIMLKYAHLGHKLGSLRSSIILCQLFEKKKQYNEAIKICLHINNYNQIVKIYEKIFKEPNKYLNDELIQIFLTLDHHILCPRLQFIQTLLNTKIDLMELHFKYSPTTEGFLKAKNNFIQLVQGK